MPGLVNWIVLLAGTAAVFVLWSWVPLERLDKYWSLNNPIGRPLLNTLVLTGGPALYANVTGTPHPWLIIPIAFAITQYAVLSGRFLKAQMYVAGWVMVLASIGIWLWFFLA